VQHILPKFHQKWQNKRHSNPSQAISKISPAKFQAMPVNNHGTEASMPQVNIHNRPLLLAIGNLTALKTSCINLCLERKHVNDHLIPSLTGFNLIASDATLTLLSTWHFYLIKFRKEVERDCNNILICFWGKNNWCCCKCKNASKSS